MKALILVAMVLLFAGCLGDGTKSSVGGVAEIPSIVTFKFIDYSDSFLFDYPNGVTRLYVNGEPGYDLGPGFNKGIFSAFVRDAILSECDTVWARFSKVAWITYDKQTVLICNLNSNETYNLRFVLSHRDGTLLNISDTYRVPHQQYPRRYIGINGQINRPPAESPNISKNEYLGSASVCTIMFEDGSQLRLPEPMSFEKCRQKIEDLTDNGSVGGFMSPIHYFRGDFRTVD